MASIKESEQIAQLGISNPESSVLASYFILQFFSKKTKLKNWGFVFFWVLLARTDCISSFKFWRKVDFKIECLWYKMGC